LIDAEAAYDRQPARERDHYSDHGDLRRGERPRKRGFLGELFD
jgi:hypothetical protein